MKTIVLFHRLDLTDLNIDLAEQLHGKVNVIHLAYSDFEVQKLRAANIAGEIIHFKNEVRACWSKIDKVAPEWLSKIDADVLEQTGGSFTLNGIIQSDRGFNLLSNNECIRLSAAYYEFWDELIRDRGVDYILHEPPSLVFNFLGLILCSKYGGQYLYNIMVPSEPGTLGYLWMNGFDYTCDDLDQTLDTVQRGEIKIDEGRCRDFLAECRKDLTVYLGSSVSYDTRLPRLLLIALRNIVRRMLRSKRYDRHVDNIDYWELRQNLAWQKFINLLNYKFQVDFSEFDSKCEYYFYPFQLEPESVVLYQGHGIYTNQIKLIQNIAAQLPPGAYLYVKDHPHDHGYREAVDYQRITNIPNVRLLRSNIPAKKVIQHSRGVMTINGTAGFEAIMMGKQVYCFGKTFYSSCPQVTYIHNIRDLRKAVYANENIQYRDEETLYPFLTAYFSAKKEGLCDYYAGRSTKYGIDLKENARKISRAFLDKAY